jgi:hypothetical protein
MCVRGKEGEAPKGGEIFCRSRTSTTYIITTKASAAIHQISVIIFVAVVASCFCHMEG